MGNEEFVDASDSLDHVVGVADNLEGALECLEGALQAYKAFHPTK